MEDLTHGELRAIRDSNYQLLRANKAEARVATLEDALRRIVLRVSYGDPYGEEARRIAVAAISNERKRCS